MGIITSTYQQLQKVYRGTYLFFGSQHTNRVARNVNARAPALLFDKLDLGTLLANDQTQTVRVDVERDDVGQEFRHCLLKRRF